MGREIRRVPADWEHPRRSDGNHRPLLEGPYSERLAEWEEGKRQWERGLRYNYAEDRWVLRDNVDIETWGEWEGERPNPDDFMPEWPETERTHIQMYETCSEGTPISPVMKQPESLARWLADTGASAFGGMTATYDEWLSTIRVGFAVGLVCSAKGIQSGVEANGEGVE